MKKKKIPLKTETIEEFLARGGEITRVEPEDKAEIGQIIKQTSGGPPQLFSLDEAQHFFGEVRKFKPRKKKQDLSKIDKTEIPSSLHYLLEDKNV